MPYIFICVCIAILAVLQLIQTLRFERLVDHVAEVEAKLARKCAELDLCIKCNERDIRALGEKLSDLPIEELNNSIQEEKTYLASLNNIFSYGSDIPKLNLDGLDK